MKKAKLMLSAIAIFAVLATAFAFKTSKFSTHFIYTGTNGTCETKVNSRAISNGTPSIYATLVPGDCEQVFTVEIDD